MQSVPGCFADCCLEMQITQNLTYVKLCLVLDTLPVFVDIRRRYCRTGWPKIKLQTLVHIITKY